MDQICLQERSIQKKLQTSQGTKDLCQVLLQQPFLQVEPASVQAASLAQRLAQGVGSKNALQQILEGVSVESVLQELSYFARWSILSPNALVPQSTEDVPSVHIPPLFLHSVTPPVKFPRTPVKTIIRTTNTTRTIIAIMIVLRLNPCPFLSILVGFGIGSI